jgi:outer membrane lipoprotein-sorting protein
MRNIAIMFVMCISAVSLFAQTPNAAELLSRVDNNEIFSTIEYEGEMIIEYQNRRYVKSMKAWAKENSDSFIEFFNPEDRGTKYLKKGGRLYVYTPDKEGITLISGHMLKESMRGSDMSYEDTIDNATLSSRYTPALLGEETLNGKQAWVLELSAKNRSESYPKRKLWIDIETGDLLRYELFALSGAVLKEYNLLKVEVIGTKRFPVESEIRDLLRRGSRTVVVMKNVVLDKPIPDSVFSQRNLER